MPKNRLSDLRDHLFATIEGLRDEDDPVDVNRARAVAEVAGKIIDSAKLELRFLELKGQEAESDFLAPHKLRAVTDGTKRLSPRKP